MEKDIAIGSAGSASIAQSAGKLALKVQVAQPISIGGVELGSLSGDVVVALDESAVLKALADKYVSNALVKEGIDLIAGALAAIP